jgi:hypothetical protein
MAELIHGHLGSGPEADVCDKCLTLPSCSYQAQEMKNKIVIPSTASTKICISKRLAIIRIMP